MYKFEILQDSQGDWRWRTVAPNGEIVADSSKGYSEQSCCVEEVSRFASAMIHQHPMVVEYDGRFLTHV